MLRVSVIITTYNSEKSIVRTLESLHGQEGINQDFELEIIVVDDCSTDGTQDLLKKCNIKYFTTPYNSGGPNMGRNIGLKMASGDYICIVDHDDIWLPIKLKSQLAVVHLAKIISSGHTVINSINNKVIEYKGDADSEYTIFDTNETFKMRLSKQNNGQHTYLGGLLFHSSLKTTLFEENFGVVDYDWLVRLFHNQKSVEVNKSLYNRLLEGENLSMNKVYRIRDFYYSLMTLEFYQDQYPKECLTAYYRLHGSLARYYYVQNEMKKARFYFVRSNKSLKTAMYYITSFVGHEWVKRRFNVFG